MALMHPAELAILLHRALEVRLARLQELLASGDWPEEVEPLHQVRVAARRLGAVLDLVDPEAYPAHKSHRRALKDLVDALSLTRELDVHADSLQAHHDTARTPALAAVVEHVQDQVDHARTKARRTLRRDLERLKLAGLARLLEVPSLPDPFQSTSLQEAAWELLATRSAAALQPLPELLQQEDPPTLHKGRVRIKKLRYALEALESAFVVPPEAMLAPLKALQSALGEHHDLAALEVLLWAEEARLRDRHRTVLCDGLLELLGEVAEARRAAFVHAGTLAPACAEPAFTAAIRPALGLSAPGRTHP